MYRSFAIPLFLIGVLAGCASDDVAVAPVETTIPASTTTTVAETTTTTTTVVVTTTTDPDAELKWVIALPYSWGSASSGRTEALQERLGVTVDGVYGVETRGAHIAALESFGMTTDNVPVAPVVARTVNAPQECERWHALALQVGFTEAQWPKLVRIMFRESRCDPMAWNRADPTPDGSRGLTQINGFWCRPNSRFPGGWLQQKGVLTVCADLHNAETSLRATYAIWTNSGWGPWGG